MSDRVFNLEDIVLRWKIANGAPTRSKRWDTLYYQIPYKDRLELVTGLVQQLKDLGKPREYFHGTLIDDLTCMIVPNKKSVTPESYKSIVSCTRQDIRTALVTVYDAELIEPIYLIKNLAPTQQELDKHDVSKGLSVVPAVEPEYDYELDEETALILGIKK